ncbi:arginyl-tRNA--protein transferase 1-like isoform X1 [Amphibalanus amphitrite]|uniref:arginyl-tRNA--protein transferase 1-like isoform X1 n=1 Tax=Amphibalanus amphitrite TaxID=1232801 RepID=UPI001C910CBF|nr:arginyl-tRNA--protein transferase 1-like isoform X1 [Amphibalanus amphitrite]XP_043193472.1 arginyl-tRNA--protein transferase 1-like isoform X1 [Amphibalanus amphitrite]XP_043193481.1 arginyl-tRNA--protein transferase 1-like isoform X1 [Amphibalanus amphitrite]
MSRNYSIVQLFPDSPGHQCGYCKSKKGFIAQGMWAHALDVQEYQALLDRGWRRSGCYCYKPVMHEICCPLYTIRCDALGVRLTKSQKKIAKRMRNFLHKGSAKLNQQETSAGDDTMDGSVEHGHVDLEIDAETLEKMASRASGDLPQGAALLNGDLADSPRTKVEGPSDLTSSETGESTGQTTVTTKLSERPASSASQTSVQPGEGMDPSRPPCKKQKALRRERWRKKHGDAPLPAAGGCGGGGGGGAPIPLEELLKPPEDAKHTLELRLVSTAPSNREFASTKAASYQVYKQYQMAVHGDTEDKCCMRTFERFLCATPLKGAPPYGAYHHQYWLDGELIAVGVLDVLPSCVSSKYFYYLPRFGFLSLGTYGSLRELELTRQLQRSRPELRYYYMGYYIHTCPKMRYKGRIGPSDLLCPETYTWHPLSACEPLLDKHKYARFAPAGPPLPAPDLSAALVLYDGQPMRYRRYQQLRGASDQQEMGQYLRLVGPAVASQTLVFRE